MTDEDAAYTDEQLDRITDFIVGGIIDRQARIRAGKTALDALKAVRDGKRLPAHMTEPYS